MDNPFKVSKGFQLNNKKIYNQISLKKCQITINSIQYLQLIKIKELKFQINHPGSSIHNSYNINHHNIINNKQYNIKYFYSTLMETLSKRKDMLFKIYKSVNYLLSDKSTFNTLKFP